MRRSCGAGLTRGTSRVRRSAAISFVCARPGCRPRLSTRCCATSAVSTMLGCKSVSKPTVVAASACATSSRRPNSRRAAPPIPMASGAGRSRPFSKCSAASTRPSRRSSSADTASRASGPRLATTLRPSGCGDGLTLKKEQRIGLVGVPDRRRSAVVNAPLANASEGRSAASKPRRGSRPVPPGSPASAAITCISSRGPRSRAIRASRSRISTWPDSSEECSPGPFTTPRGPSSSNSRCTRLQVPLRK